jgi:transposase InsO family protein
MAMVLHPRSKTTYETRLFIKNSSLTIDELATKFSINRKTVMKWKKADSIEDKRSGPKNPKSVLSELEQQLLVEFRRNTKMSLDDIFIAFKDKIPSLSRSNLHRLFVRNGVSKLPKEAVEKRKKFKDYPPGYAHIDITEIRLKAVKYYLFVAIDRTTKYIFAQLFEQMTIENSCIFLQNFLADYPVKIVKILTDNGAQFTYELLAKHLRPKNKIHPFDCICNANKIEHRLIKFRHPWTNGQVEIYNKLIKNATIKKYFYESFSELNQHIQAFLLYYNYQKPNKQLKYTSPYQKILDYYIKEPNLFKENPMDKIVGLNT